MNKILNIIVAVAALAFCACNNEWEDEQFAHYVGFKAPINSEGVTSVYLKLRNQDEIDEKGPVTYQLPLVVSGSTPHSGDLKVKVELDLDSLRILNTKNIGKSRMDIWWHPAPGVDTDLELDFTTQLDPNPDPITGKVYTYGDWLKTPSPQFADERAFSFPSEVTIPSGESVTCMDITFNFDEKLGWDWTKRYILPLKVSETQSGYTANTRKHYNNAMLNIIPFNDYSGSYGASTMLGYSADDNGDFTDEMMSMAPLTMSDKIFYAVDDERVFFYPGIIDHTYKERADYKVYITFDKSGALLFDCPNPELDFQVVGAATYDTPSRKDENKPYLEYRYVILQFTYDFTDKTGGVDTRYRFKGAMTMQRAVNTQIPDQDQAIQWE